MQPPIDLSRYRLGFELETEAFHGYRWGQIVRREERFDEIRHHRDVQRRIDFWWAAQRINLDISDIPSQLPRPVTHTGTISGLPCQISETLRNIPETWEWFQSYVEESSIPAYLRRFIDRQDYAHEQEYEMLSEQFKELIRHESFRVERDGTVSGPEIITTSGFSIPDVKNLARIIFQHNMRVSEKCSFHIHLSVDRMDLAASNSMQMFMLMYLYSNIHRIPTRVLVRWVDRHEADSMNYFSPTKDSCSDRYAFVAFRAPERRNDGCHKPSTWEFRCWGNIRTAEDAFACIDLSVEAFGHAYHQVKILNRGCTRGRREYTNALIERARNELESRQGRGE